MLHAVYVSGAPGDDTEIKSADEAVIGEQMTFTCDVSDKGNPEADDYSWDVNDDRWNCAVDSVNVDVYSCTVFNDCTVTVSCTPQNSHASGQTATQPVVVTGGMIKLNDHVVLILYQNYRYWLNVKTLHSVFNMFLRLTQFSS